MARDVNIIDIYENFRLCVWETKGLRAYMPEFLGFPAAT